jgi:hypothetical protein
MPTSTLTAQEFVDALVLEHNANNNTTSAKRIMDVVECSGYEVAANIILRSSGKPAIYNEPAKPIADILMVWSY